MPANSAGSLLAKKSANRNPKNRPAWIEITTAPAVAPRMIRLSIFTRPSRTCARSIPDRLCAVQRRGVQPRRARQDTTERGDPADAHAAAGRRLQRRVTLTMFFGYPRLVSYVPRPSIVAVRHSESHEGSRGRPPALVGLFGTFGWPGEGPLARADYPRAAAVALSHARHCPRRNRRADDTGYLYLGSARTTGRIRSRFSPHRGAGFTSFQRCRGGEAATPRGSRTTTGGSGIEMVRDSTAIFQTVRSRDLRRARCQFSLTIRRSAAAPF